MKNLLALAAATAAASFFIGGVTHHAAANNARHDLTSAATDLRAAQTPPPEQKGCPTVDIAGPSSVNAGENAFFGANIRGGDPNVTPTFKWVVPADVNIVSGQGSPSLTIATDNLGGQSVTITVEVGGFKGCEVITSSLTVQVTAPPRPSKVDEYSNVSPSDEKDRLNSFANSLANAPGQGAVIIAYGGRRSGGKGCRGEGQSRANRARDYLISQPRDIDSARVQVVDGGYKQVWTVELWMVPASAGSPNANPNFEPTRITNCSALPKL